MSAPIIFDYNIAMQDFNGLTYMTSKQHKYSSVSRIERDTVDISKGVTCSTFSADPSLRNIINGILGKKDVNVYKYKSVRRNVEHNMIGQNLSSFAFKRIDSLKI